MRPLYNIEPTASPEEIEAAARQFVRKVSGYPKPSRVNQAAFDQAVAAIAVSVQTLLANLETKAPPRPTRRQGAHLVAGSAIIKFYDVRAPYGQFSNFSPHPVFLDGSMWKTSEHFFQGQKFLDAEIRYQVQAAPTPKAAATLGRNPSLPLRPDWEQVKDEVMRKAVRAKFTQHADLRQLLLSTSDAVLVEHAPKDSYWGDGGDGSGKNILGRILMEIRAELKRDTLS